MKRILFIFIGVTLLATMALAGCAPTPAPSPKPVAGTGTLTVLVTDAPPKDEVTSIMVTASKLEIHRAVAEQERQQIQTGDNQTDNQTREQQQVQQGEGEWITIDIAEAARSFDLLKVKGVEQLFATGQVAAGKYTQVRLIIDKIEVALGGGELKPAKVPSGELKLVQPFDVLPSENTTIVLDFDADKSVNITGKDDIMVKPVVKLIVKPGTAKGPTAAPAVSLEESQKIAENFVKNEATFVFDGIPETLKLTATTAVANTPYRWQFTFQFDSRQAGYGDRTGQMLAQVITPHRAVVTVERGKVTGAVMDEKWDMLKQKELKAKTAAESVGIDATYDGKEISVSAGSQFTVTLESNPTTGFRWELAGITDKTVLEVVDSKYEPGEKAGQKPPVAGAGGTEVWTFKALKAGTAKLSMEYSRPWQGGEKGVQTFNLTVVVK